MDKITPDINETIHDFVSKHEILVSMEKRNTKKCRFVSFGNLSSRRGLMGILSVLDDENLEKCLIKMKEPINLLK